jgi:hypothetical protein
MTRDKHNKDTKLRNFDEKLHNSHEPELTWQEKTDLSPEDDIEGGSEIYYFTDEDGDIHSRGFRTKELIPDALAKKRTKRETPKTEARSHRYDYFVRPNEALQQEPCPHRSRGAPS